MAQARFSIGIDLGTTNSALAFVPLAGEAAPEILHISQWESVAGVAEWPTLPSFLYLPEDAVATQLRGRIEGAGAWIAGRFARTKAGETPGRVVHSAKSWLCYHAVDRLEPFLPWGSSDLTREQKISPVRASALLLNYLRGAWNSRFAEPGFAFDNQEITIAVPASFDAAAQRLTIAAAEDAGFPYGVRLLEEPQAAFYCWLERHEPARDVWRGFAGSEGEARHVLVVDIGGGTSDFSLFELRLNGPSPIPDTRRVAVSEHILLGGDNIDLAIAYLVEGRLTGGAHGQFSGAQWDQLVAACRNLKEQVLSGPGTPDDRFAVASAGRGSGLVAASQAATVTRADIEGVLLNGFFPNCDKAARPGQTQGALREWGLPYANDSAITRHLADFLRDRPRIDAVLFNGGSVTPPMLRLRICEQIGAWQDGVAPLVLENAEPALAVARGAARFGALVHRQTARIAAGAARAVFLEVQGVPAPDGQVAPTSLICLLPRGASPEEPFEIAIPALEVRTDQPVCFRAFSSTQHGRSRTSDVLAWREGDFHALPPLQTIVKTNEPSRSGTSGTVPVRLVAQINALGLLQVACVSADPAIQQSWPLEFNLRPHDQGSAGVPDGGAPREAAVPVNPNATAEALDAARKRIGVLFCSRTGPRDKPPPGLLLKNLERVLGLLRSGWNGPLLRALWAALAEQMDGRRRSVDHEETWLVTAGFLLRPGFGVAGDDLRIDSLWRLHEAGPCFPGRRIKNQECILWRRVAGGLSRERQTKLLAGELDRLRGGKAPDELVRLVGSLELLPVETKVALIKGFIDVVVGLVQDKRHCAPYLAALGLLLNRVPLRAGPETVVSPDLVERAYAAFSGFDWAEPELLELQTLFLRAARVVGDRGLNVPAPLRTLIAGKLEQAGVPPRRTARIKGFIALERNDRASLYDEPLPPGLILGAE
jgi:molecular chaperone DnaK (HSP70)